MREPIEPGTCPECGGHELRPVRRDDIGFDEPEGPVDAYPGARACKRCGAVVRYGD